MKTVAKPEVVNANHAKFISLVQQLDVADPSYASRVAELHNQQIRRDTISGELKVRLRGCEGEVRHVLQMNRDSSNENILSTAMPAAFWQAVDAAVERFVVNHFK